MQATRGAYPADRAAALSGVPISTVHYWAREEILVPSVSAHRIKLWSYSDLMALRTIQWLRRAKTASDGAAVPPSTMPAVRRALKQLEELDLSLWSDDQGPAVSVDRGGKIQVHDTPDREEASRQRAFAAGAEDFLRLIEPFHGAPDLHSPRPLLRIVPGKLGGSPHVAHTRLESQAVGALSSSGLPVAKIYRLYPDVEPRAIDEALELEQQLAA